MKATTIKNDLVTSVSDRLNAAFREGRLDPEVVAERLLSHIAAGMDDAVFVAHDSRLAFEQAKFSSDRIRRGIPRSTIEGIPVAFKDNFDIKGIRTKAGSSTREKVTVASSTAPVALRVMRQGGVFAGKTNMSEFAFSGLGVNRYFGTPSSRSSKNGTLLPGGSSSGNGVGLANGLFPFAVGTDTSGSVRVPASCNGVVGYKPSAQRFSTQGVFPLSETLDVCGPMALTVQDCVYLDQAMRGASLQELGDVDPGGIKFVVPANEFFESIDIDILERFQDVIKAIRSLGLKVNTIELPSITKAQSFMKVTGTIVNYEAYHSIFSELSQDSLELIDPFIKERLQEGKNISASDYQSLLLMRTKLMYEFERELGDSCLMFPTIPMKVPTIEKAGASYSEFKKINRLMLKNTMLINYLDAPSVNIPIGLINEIFNIGLSLSVIKKREESLMKYARVLEAIICKEEMHRTVNLNSSIYGEL